VLAAVFNAEARSLSAALEEMPAADFVTLSHSPTAQPTPSDPACSGAPHLADAGQWEQADGRTTEWEPFQSSVGGVRLHEAAAADAGAAGSPAAVASPDTVAAEPTGSSLLDFEALEAGIEANPFADMSPMKGAAATAAEAEPEVEPEVEPEAEPAVAEEEVDIELLLGGSAAVMASLEEVNDGWTADAAAAEAPSSSEKDAKLRGHRHGGVDEFIGDWSSGSSGGGGGGGGAAWAASDYTGVAARAPKGSDAPFVWRTNPVAAEEQATGEEPSSLTCDMFTRLADDVCAGDIMSMSPRLISLEVRATATASQTRLRRFGMLCRRGCCDVTKLSCSSHPRHGTRSGCSEMQMNDDDGLITPRLHDSLGTPRAHEQVLKQVMRTQPRETQRDSPEVNVGALSPARVAQVAELGRMADVTELRAQLAEARAAHLHEVAVLQVPSTRHVPTLVWSRYRSVFAACA
jgi:hypothetical protein